ncbi:hypothetical protein HGP16_26590 [Rhizobium sp. P40RR-XXII]|uniref:hypothetical protein n=1 Tax=unclassified Rhizobium TaxID=2613769 RepID=UPI001456314A|nr:MULTISPECIES: hypothetical protein [unclassified Rhizobium]NLR89245.1 hypothetical protein [Rhizobium sp. P28RR-XV]NLS20107.1 hypothetical protein [Rhizobium sp. P40RR-XXII]
MRYLQRASCEAMYSREKLLGSKIMNDIPKRALFVEAVAFDEDGAWSKLRKLADMLEIDADTGAMTIRNGKSSLTLRKDGSIIVHGVSIAQSAERHISLDAATIDLN